MDKELNKIGENLIPMKLTTIPYNTKILQHNKTQTYLIAFLAVNNGYTSSYSLIRYVTKGHIAMHTILFSIQNGFIL